MVRFARTYTPEVVIFIRIRRSVNGKPVKSTQKGPILPQTDPIERR